MTRRLHVEHRHLDLACDLAAADAGARSAEWRQLRSTYGLGTDVVPRGARLSLSTTAWDEAVDLAQREGACCGFLDFDLVAAGDELRLDITSPVPEAGAVIAWLAGLEPGHQAHCR